MWPSTVQVSTGSPNFSPTFSPMVWYIEREAGVILKHSTAPLTNEFGSGSCYFYHWPSRHQQKTNKKKFSACYFLKVHLLYFSKIKVKKKSQNSRNQGFSYYFCLMIEGGGSRPRRPKNMWIRIQIRNTGIFRILFTLGTDAKPSQAKKRDCATSEI